MRSSRPGASGPVDPVSAAERRGFPRSTQRYEVCIRATDSPDEPILTQGTLINVSLSGALMSVKDFLSRDQPCTVEIFGAFGRVIPNRIVGRVVGTSLGPKGDFFLRVEFSEPLEEIKEPGKL